MQNSMPRNSSAERKAYIVTGPTSGIGRRTALDMAKRGTVVLVGRDPEKTRCVAEGDTAERWECCFRRVRLVRYLKRATSGC
jgi:NAD(P)-dependent dehydrogenase (short-subunit alcohol dehydrogenase family)